MSELLGEPRAQPDTDGSILQITPESAGWTHVGFEVVALAEGQGTERTTGGRELCVVVISGSVDIASEHGEWAGLASIYMLARGA